jgi:DNA polymerase III delta prime subunit
MSSADTGPSVLLRQAVERERIHSAYLLSGPGPAPQQAALEFARALACVGDGTRPCEACLECRRSAAPNEIAIDGSGKSGPPFRQIGDHPDLLWVERGRGDTRVRIAQIRAVQSALRLRTTTPGRRAVVIADAEWLNQEAQNALLRLLEEPPPRTTLVLVASTSAGLLATVRSRCQRLPFPAARPGLDASPEDAEADRLLERRLDAIRSTRAPELLDWAEEFRGPRAPAAEGVQQLLETAQAWLRKRVAETADADAGELRPWLDAFRTLSGCRKALVQRNANPQMVAERALFALREAAA